MDSRTGKKIRLGRLFNQRSSKSLIVAYSHGLLLGPRPGMVSLAEMRRTAQSICRADGLMVAPGLLTLLEDAFIGKDRPALILHLDYQSFSRSVLSYSEGATAELAQVEHALTAGADCIMTYLYMGYQDPEREKMEILRNARLARACEAWGLVLMVEPRSAREATHPADKTDPALLAMYCRIAAEVGADMVKCIYPDSTRALAQVISGCPVPVLLAGGSKTQTPEMAYERARSAMEAGAAGLVFGRNIFEAEDPAIEVTRFRQIIHGE